MTVYRYDICNTDSGKQNYIEAVITPNYFGDDKQTILLKSNKVRDTFASAPLSLSIYGSRQLRPRKEKVKKNKK